MFYPVESLKRGGRFYMCWVADSWPLRFATITHRQLWSQDIRRICDDLLEVVMNESGRPVNRFSLRLSSQLMRGLVRLYQRKVTVLLGELCMINANVTKHVNKKWNIYDVEATETVRRVLARISELPPQHLVLPEEPVNEPRVEELIQNSGNAVANIQDITLKESTIPQIILPPNDGFGEEHPEQALQLLADRTLETMLGADAPAAVSALALDSTSDLSRDRSQNQSRRDALNMDPIEELDQTLFQKSVIGDRLTMGELEKDVPEVPEILFPEIPAPPPEKESVQEPQVDVAPIPELEKQPDLEEPAPKEREIVEIELEELVEPPAKRRRLKKLIVDKRTKLTADYLVTRIENPQVELRCEDSTDDIIVIRVPSSVYFGRAAHAGARIRGGIAAPLTRLFQRNLGVFHSQASAEREMEQAVTERGRRIRTRSVLERIDEEAELLVTEPAQIQVEPQDLETPAMGLNTTASRVSLNTDAQNVTLPEDIADLPTQKLEVLSQSRKRVSDFEQSPKRQRLFGYVSFRESQQMAAETVLDIEAEKENIPNPANVPRPSIRHKSQPSQASPEKSLTVMLQEVGLADLAEAPAPAASREANEPQVRRRDSEGSETPLGSLDRTKVSLGDSDQTTDSKRFIREQWGTEGTMVKILACVKAQLRPLGVAALLARGPLVRRQRALIAARCFSSILKLKQHGFVKIIKNPENLEIRDILLGPKFDQVN